MLMNLNSVYPLFSQTKLGLRIAGNSCELATIMLDLHLPRRRKSMYMHTSIINSGSAIFISLDGQDQTSYGYADKQLWQSIYFKCFPCSLDRITNGFSLPRFNGFYQCINSFSLCSVCKAGSWING